MKRINLKEFILNHKKELLTVIILIIMFSSGIIVKAISNKRENKVEEDDFSSSQIKVTIKGEVKYPNTYYLEEGSKVRDVIILASGLTKYSDTSFINLNKELENDEIIFISKKVNQNTIRINVNIASINELKTLNDVGETLAYNIIIYRTINGPFNSINDLLKVSGMSNKIISKNINEICLS